MRLKLTAETPLRLGRRFFFALACLTASGASAQSVFQTEGFGLSLTQNGTPVAIFDRGSFYEATLIADAFELGANASREGREMWLSIGLEPGVFEQFGSPEPLFGPASGYAREAKPRAALFLTDPACADGIGPGFNILGPDHAVAGSWPVTSIEPDRASDDCALPSVTPQENLITPGRRLFLVASDGEGADFLVLVFEGPGSS